MNDQMTERKWNYEELARRDNVIGVRFREELERGGFIVLPEGPSGPDMYGRCRACGAEFNGIKKELLLLTAESGLSAFPRWKKRLQQMQPSRPFPRVFCLSVCVPCWDQVAPDAEPPYAAGPDVEAFIVKSLVRVEQRIKMDRWKDMGARIKERTLHILYQPSWYIFNVGAFIARFGASLIGRGVLVIVCEQGAQASIMERLQREDQA
jgi:hypothetical protein